MLLTFITSFVNLYFSFKSKSISNIFDGQFTLSFSGDSYLHTDGLFSRPGSGLVILIKPFSIEGLVMFAYDEKVSLEDLLILLIHVLYLID